MTVGEMIYKLRKERKLSRRKLGEISGITEGMIRHYELGERNPKVKTLQKFANIFGVPVDYFMDIEANDEIISKRLIENHGDVGMFEQLKILSEELNISVPALVYKSIIQGFEVIRSGVAGVNPAIIDNDLKTAIERLKEKGANVNAEEN